MGSPSSRKSLQTTTTSWLSHAAGQWQAGRSGLVHAVRSWAVVQGSISSMLYMADSGEASVGRACRTQQRVASSAPFSTGEFETHSPWGSKANIWLLEPALVRLPGQTHLTRLSTSC